MKKQFEQAKELDVTNGLVFQRIFGKVGNEEITKVFLERILGIEIVVEMQASPYKYMPERVLYYWASAYAEGFKRSD